MFSIANLITLVRLILAMPIVYYLFADQTSITLVLYIFFLFLDFLDGFSARKLKCETKFGKNFDFITDILVGNIIFIILVIKGNVPLTYLGLVMIPLVLFGFGIVYGIDKKTFKQSTWRKANGFVYYFSILLFLVNTKATIIAAYALLLYAYLAAIKYLTEIFRS